MKSPSQQAAHDAEEAAEVAAANRAARQRARFERTLKQVSPRQLAPDVDAANATVNDSPTDALPRPHSPTGSEERMAVRRSLHIEDSQKFDQNQTAIATAIAAMIHEREESDEECAWSPGSATGRQGSDLVAAKNARPNCRSPPDSHDKSTANSEIGVLMNMRIRAAEATNEHLNEGDRETDEIDAEMSSLQDRLATLRKKKGGAEVEVEMHSSYGSISSAKDDSSSDSDDDYDPTVVPTYYEEFQTMLWFAIPVTLGSSARMLVFNVDAIYLGHIGTKQMAGASLALDLTEMTCELFSSAAYTLIPLVSQAVGTGKPEVAGQWAQLTMAAVMMVAIPLAIFYFTCTHAVVSLFSPDPEVADFARQFNHVYAFGILVLAASMVMRSYLNGLMETTGPVVSTISVVVLNIVFNQLFIFGLPGWFGGLGFIGSPLATTASMIVQVLIIIAISFVWQKVHIKNKAWDGLSMVSFRQDRVDKFASMAVPATIGELLESVGSTVLIMMASRFGPAVTASIQIIFIMEELFSAASSGFAAALEVRLSRHLGGGNKLAAFVTMGVAFPILIGTTVVICGLIYWQRWAIAALYTPHADTQEMVVLGFPPLCACLISVVMATSLAYSLMAMGRNDEVATTQLVSVWLVMLPVGSYHIYTAESAVSGYIGVLWTVPLSYCVKAVMCFIMLRNTDWEKQIAEIKKSHQD